MRTIVCLAMTAALSMPSFGQSEQALQQEFEGKSVVARIDMPGTSEGVDIHPTAALHLDTHKLADRIKKYGIAVHVGETMMITKIILKKDHIEFHLGGGGFGSFSDRVALNSANPVATYELKSARERDLENDLRYENNYRQREYMREEIDRLRQDRMNDNSRAAVANIQSMQARKANEREMRSHSGSRFNIWYKDGFGENALTPEGVMDALSQYLDFSPTSPAEGSNLGVATSTDNSGSDEQPAQQGSSSQLRTLKRGMTVLQVEQILGPAIRADQNLQGGLTVVVREYSSQGLKVSAQFVGGVLTDFTITPN